MSSCASATVTTPNGPFTIVVRDDAVIASGWSADLDAVLKPVAAARRPTEITARRDLGPFTNAVERYYRGELSAVDDIAVDQHSGPFIEWAWQVLRTVPAGAPVTYADFAAKVGRPDAARAAANACACNCAALFVPCHRVVRTGGALGGFRWGLPVKRWLLDFEAGTRTLTSL